MGKQRTAYTTKEKLAAIKFAEAHGNRAAQREFGINKSNIRDWRKKKDRLEKLPKSKMADRGSKAHHPALEEELMSFIWTEDVVLLVFQRESYAKRPRRLPNDKR